MRVVVTFAVDSEFAPWRKSRPFRRDRNAAPARYEYSTGDLFVRVVLTGMGERLAGQAAKAALADGADLCISSGLAGGLQAGQRSGDILVAQVVVKDHEPVAIASDPELIALASDCGARQVSRFVTSRVIVARSADKQLLGERADAVEMESLAVLGEAARRGVPAVAVRAIADTVDFDLPLDFSTASDPSGQIRASRVLGALAMRPQRLPALLRFARDCRRASQSLAAFLDAYTGCLAERYRGSGSRSELLATT
jgi:adenosylhomocysteine nucleosidase